MIPGVDTGRDEEFCMEKANLRLSMKVPAILSLCVLLLFLLLTCDTYSAMPSPPRREVIICNAKLPGNIKVGIGYVQVIEYGASSAEEVIVLIEKIVDVEFERYVAGVVQGEMGIFNNKDKHYEAWKAQAVAARTYALKRHGRRSTHHIDIGKLDLLVDSHFLFRVSSEYQISLDNTKVSEGLAQEFENNRQPLSQSPIVSIEEKGSNWLITDEERGRAYIVSKDGDRLSVRGPRELDVDKRKKQEEDLLKRQRKHEKERKAIRSDVDICSTERCQSFMENSTPVFKDVAEITAGQVIEYNGRIIDATFFSSSRTNYTKNTEDVWANYSVYGRKTVTEESIARGSGGHGVGMSQYGARGLSERRVKYEDIIRHYYGPVPPYLKEVKITQGGKLMYHAYWVDSNNYPNPKRQLEIKKNISLNTTSDAIIEICFSERVATGQSAGKIRVKVGTEEASYVPGSHKESNDVPEKLCKRLSAAQLRKISSAQPKRIDPNTHTISISIEATHEFAEKWQLDKKPETFAYKNHNADHLVGYEPGTDRCHQISILPYQDSSGNESQ